MVTQHAREGINHITLQFAEKLKESLIVHSIYLYGSYAKGTNREDSDIDIAAVAEGFTGDIIEDTFMLMRARRGVDHRIEPRPFKVDEFNEQDPLAKEVLRTGIRIV